MKVSLLESTPNAEDIIYSAARQCYYPGSIAEKYPFKDNSNKEKLIDKVLSSGHESVLEHVSFTFSVSGVSRALLAQLSRHRVGISLSVQSQRYTGAKGVGHIVPESICKDATTNKKFNDFILKSFELYQELVDDGIPYEDARFVLTEATTTNLVLTMNVRSIIHFFHKRCCTTAQWEIRELAKSMLKILKEKFPIIFKNAGPQCYSLGYCPEGEERSCGIRPLKKYFLDSEG